MLKLELLHDLGSGLGLRIAVTTMETQRERTWKMMRKLAFIRIQGTSS